MLREDGIAKGMHERRSEGVREHDVGLSEKDHHRWKNSHLKALNEESIRCASSIAGASVAGVERTKKVHDEVRQIGIEVGVQIIYSL